MPVRAVPAPRLSIPLLIPLLLVGPAIAAAQTPAASCALLYRTGDQLADKPLVGFDPADRSAPLPAAPPGAEAALVLCHRATIVPEMSDYRVPAEAHLPLAITDERATVVLDIAGGRLQATVRKGQPSEQEQDLLQSRVQEMDAAMKAATPKP